MFNIVLVSPQIPPNTGNIGRLCVNLGARLHLVKPLGFDISQKALRRAGLDYWDRLDLVVWDSLEEFLKSHPINSSSCLLTTKSNRVYWDFKFSLDSYLIFGSETKGLPEELLRDNWEQTATIPMTKEGRSLNLSVSVGIVAYEALRQCTNSSNIKDGKL